MCTYKLITKLFPSYVVQFYVDNDISPPSFSVHGHYRFRTTAYRPETGSRLPRRTRYERYRVGGRTRKLLPPTRFTLVTLLNQTVIFQKLGESVISGIFFPFIVRSSLTSYPSVVRFQISISDHS